MRNSTSAMLLSPEGFINSGIQVRSERLPGSHEVKGYQVDAGDEWWGEYDHILSTADLQANLDTDKPLD